MVELTKEMCVSENTLSKFFLSSFRDRIKIVQSHFQVIEVTDTCGRGFYMLEVEGLDNRGDRDL